MLSDLLLALALYALWYGGRLLASNAHLRRWLPDVSRAAQDNTFRPLGLGGDDDFRPLGEGQPDQGPTCWVCGQPKSWGDHTGCH